MSGEHDNFFNNSSGNFDEVNFNYPLSMDYEEDVFNSYNQRGYSLFPKENEDECLGFTVNNLTNCVMDLEEEEKLYSQSLFRENDFINVKPSEKKANNSISSENEKTKNTTKTTKSKIFDIKKDKKRNININTNMLGRKRKDEENGGKHTKFDFDNTVRKIKSNLFDVIKNYMNNSLKEEEGEEILPKEKQRKRKIYFDTECFLKLEQKTVVSTNVEENKALLNMTLREIFSRNVSEKAKNYSSYGLEHNKYFIQQLLLNERKKRTNEILDMTFLQCLEHFRGSKYYPTLRGLEKQYENVINKMKEKENDEYIANFKKYLQTFEQLYSQKSPRNGRKNKK